MSKSQNLTFVSALPVTNPFLSGLTCKDHTALSCALIDSIKDAEAKSNNSRSPDLVPTMTYKLLSKIDKQDSI